MLRFTPDIEKRVLKALHERSAPKNCPICGQDAWTLVNGFITLDIQGSSDRPHLVVRGAPCVAITCNNCGNTHLLNLIKLGLDDLIEDKR